jgi:hypothetical protein
VDSRGRLSLGDRGNNRIQVFDQDFIDQWVQFSSPSGVYFDKKDVIYVADGGSGSVDQAHGDWKRGGSATQERHGDSSVLSG